MYLYISSSSSDVVEMFITPTSTHPAPYVHTLSIDVHIYPGYQHVNVCDTSYEQQTIILYAHVDDTCTWCKYLFYVN